MQKSRYYNKDKDKKADTQKKGEAMKKKAKKEPI